ncbi:ABC transporter substrate-binding protein [Mycolicibacterium hodleri]|uniref:Amino acid ABC transporter substrate-binding protein n=1 Tax=Mycolicibacterium hodleri TaxID=49897 RepID=A0A502E8V2_9MYCO|nr:ABC transporter substrate-binding protein [Mycolicibacterium hodleri]TPG32890.1 amino acid ABC transporter substrate-binding protein [Mycolicibacterium hodleri]
MRNLSNLVSTLALICLGAATACAPTDDTASSTSSAPAAASECTKDSLSTLTKGSITFGTDQPAYPPWFVDDDPANGKGFESAVAYAVAGKLGYAAEDVKWVRVPFNSAIAPGPKTFDANLNEFSITDERKQAVDFSSPYFNVTQAVVAVKSSPAAGVTTLDGLKGLKLGAQVGTTSYTAAKAIDPGVAVFNNNDDAKAALSNGQIDALVLDLPTAFQVQSELTDGVIVGQLPSGTEKAEQFGIVLDKGSPLTTCVSKAVDALGNDGELFKLQKVWLTGAGNAPVLS